jgi:predicted DNA binding CopG/RHH family protein
MIRVWSWLLIKAIAEQNRACFALAGASAAVFLLCASLIVAIASELSALDTGGKAEKSMKNKTVKYTDDKGEIIGDLRPIKKGELPSLDELVEKLREQTKVTLVLDNEAVAFFKREASKRHTSYQRMIRNLVLSYARNHAR